MRDREFYVKRKTINSLELNKSQSTVCKQKFYLDMLTFVAGLDPVAFAPDIHAEAPSSGERLDSDCDNLPQTYLLARGIVRSQRCRRRNLFLSGPPPVAGIGPASCHLEESL